MKKDYQVSVILPIYNAAKFLERSLGNLVKYDNPNLEIICVNDGSTDSSLEMIQDYASQDDRIKIIDKANFGYGHTMNKGLEMASGEYIAILEPDDYSDPQMYEKLYAAAKECDADVVKSNYFEFKQEDNSNQFFEVLADFQYNTVFNSQMNEHIFHMRPCIWTGIYRREFLFNHNIRFTETPGASYQDTAFAFKVWTAAERVLFVKDAYLHYCIDNEGSSVASKGKVFSICDEFMAIESFLNQYEKYRKFFKILQVLKLDTYVWNLDRISEEFKKEFADYIALEFIRADYLGFLDQSYFDEWRWERLQTLIWEYRNQRKSIKSQLKEKIKTIVKK